MEPFEVRELRYFVAVAEELSFSRAAERLGMAQPPLSRAIRQMERRLGADLFRRDSHRVYLTELGVSLLDHAREAVDAVQAVSRRASRAAQTTPSLVATAKPGIATEILRHVVREFESLAGAPRVEIVVSGFREQTTMVRDGRADVAVLGSPFERKGIEVEVLAIHPRVVALPADHPLTERRRLTCADLQGEPMPIWAKSSPSDIAYSSGRDRGSAIAADEGPVAGPTVSDPAQLLEVVSLGQAIALIPAWLAERNPRPDIVYAPVLDASPYSTVIAWPEGARAQHVARFVRTATELYVPREVHA
ncbi:LysR substrate-binding domain-containing protein [Actinomadura fulvescens]